MGFGGDVCVKIVLKACEVFCALEAQRYLNRNVK